MNAEFFLAELVTQKHALGTSVTDIDGQDLHIISHHRARLDRFHQPFRDQALRKFALCIFKIENRPMASGIEYPL